MQRQTAETALFSISGAHPLGTAARVVRKTWHAYHLAKRKHDSDFFAFVAKEAPTSTPLNSVAMRTGGTPRRCSRAERAGGRAVKRRDRIHLTTQWGIVDVEISCGETNGNRSAAAARGGRPLARFAIGAVSLRPPVTVRGDGQVGSRISRARVSNARQPTTRSRCHTAHVSLPNTAEENDIQDECMWLTYG